MVELSFRSNDAPLTRGRMITKRTILSILFTLLFGGMQGQNATTFTVCILLLGSLVGGRAAIWMAVASAAWCGFVAWLELHHALPRPVEPYSPINAWSAVTISG